MNDCPTCGLPMAPSPTGGFWCAVWGNHAQVRQPQVSALLLAADAELYGPRKAAA